MRYKLFIGNLCKLLKSKHKLLLQFIGLLLLCSQSVYAVDIIAHESTLPGYTDHLTTRELRAIFSLKLKQWPDGLPVTVVTMPNNSELHKSFCREILNVFSHQLKVGWDRVTYAGLGQPPVVVNSAAEMISILRDTPGAIGYIDSDQNIDDVSIKRIRLDSKRTVQR